MSRRDYYDDPQAPQANAMVPAVTGVVEDDAGRLLLILRRDNGKWALPGGGVEIGESVGDALRREVLEETGIEIEITSVVGIYSDPKHVIAYNDGEVRQEFSICLRARAVGGNLRGSNESTDVAWQDAAALPSLNLSDAQRLRIQHAGERDPSQPFIG